MATPINRILSQLAFVRQKRTQHDGGSFLMTNIFRAKGHEKIWLYMVGKTLGLLDFIYKRTTMVTKPEELDLFAKGYVKFTSNPPS